MMNLTKTRSIARLVVAAVLTRDGAPSCIWFPDD